MTKTSRHKGLVLGSFLVPEIDMIFGDGVGASLVDKDLQAAGCFTEAIRSYQIGVVEPARLQPAGATRVTLDVLMPSPTGLTEKWKQTATLCPLDWPSNYSLLRLWHEPKDLHQFVENKQVNLVICSLIGRLGDWL